MPFPNQQPRPFNRAEIESLARNQTGCYGLYRSGVSWTYVGKGDIRQRLLDHLNGDNPCINVAKPTHFVTVLASNPDALERQLIVELRPTCNKRVG